MEEAAMCYYSLYKTMLTQYESTRRQRNNIHDTLNWDVIDEAKAHYKSALIRMDADINLKNL